MNNMAAMMSSTTDMWETPKWLFDQLNEFYRFDIDVCAVPENAKCARFFTPEHDGLMQEWTGTCWMNPPYGREIGKWVRKAYESAQKGATVVCLLPARTDTSWWHDYCMKGEITFLRGRIKFGQAKNSAPFPSAIVVFRPTMNAEKIVKELRWLSENDELVFAAETMAKAAYLIESLQAQLLQKTQQLEASKRRERAAVKVLERIKRDIYDQDKIYIHIADFFGRGIYIDEDGDAE